ncbi:MAG: hypothetical protein WB696_14210 [Chthoniobacterales bacterium]
MNNPTARIEEPTTFMEEPQLPQQAENPPTAAACAGTEEAI